MAATNNKYPLSWLILNSVVTAVFFPGLILLLGGDWHWLEGWLFGLWFDAMVLLSMIYMFLKDPALLAERSKLPGSENQKTWDKYLQIGIYLIAILWLIVMPLDAKRFGWSPSFPAWLKILGGLALLPSLYLILGATVENTFLSAMVRIQTERKQYVITTGVYSFVRHPLYLGCVLMMFGAPLLLGSIWGLVISFVAVIVLVVRILGEEEMLVNELEGYVEYKKKVKYRLIPFVW